MSFKNFILFTSLFCGHMASASASYHKISDLGDLCTDEGPNSGDVVFIDLDGVLLSEGGVQKTAGIMPGTLNALKKFKDRKVPCYGLTERDKVTSLETHKTLNSYGVNLYKNRPFLFKNIEAKFYRGVIFSHGADSGQEKKSTKLLNLTSFATALGIEKQQIYFVDNDPSHFKTLNNELEKYQSQCHLVHYERKFEPVYSTLKSELPRLETLKFKNKILGGAGGVAVLEDDSGKKWTLKGWKNKAHGLNECLAAVLYQQLGGKTPSFCLFDDIPATLKGDLEIHSDGIYRLAEYINGEMPGVDSIKRELDKFFVSLAFLSFWDIRSDNFILNSNGLLYLVDMGGALLYRSLGDRKDSTKESWLISKVSEFSSFKESDNLALSAFREKDVKDSLGQIKEILDQKAILLNQLRDFCKKLFYDEEIDLLYMIEGRLNHLQFLYDFHSGQLNTLADPFLKCTTRLDSAGALICALRLGEPYVLLGKRSGHNWWGNLGGKSERGEYLYEAAAREVYEESGGKIDLGQDIKFRPSHDTLFVEKDGVTVRRFRTYLVKHDYIDPTEIKDSEYTEYKWLPMAELMKGKPVNAEGCETLQLNDGTILHPPFADSLAQKQCVEWFNLILNKKKIQDSCTQGVVGYDLKEYNGVNTTENADHQRFTLAMSTMASCSVLDKLAENREVQPVKSESAQTATHSMLAYLLKDNTEGNQTARILKAVNNHAGSLKIDEKQARFISDIIDVEKQYPDMHVLYSGLRSDIWFCYRVLSVLRHLLDQSNLQTDMLRSMDTFFDQFPTAVDLLDYIVSGQDNYSEGFKSVGMSCNPTLLNNLNHTSSCTLYYFFENHSAIPPENIWNILEVVFCKMGMNKNVINNIILIYKKYFQTEKVGSLLQVFFKPSIASQICYPCVSLGKAISKENGDHIRDSLSVLNSFRNIDVMNNLGQSPCEVQFRLHTDLSQFSEGTVIVKDYFSDGKSERLSKLDEQISRMFLKEFDQILLKTTSNQSVYQSRLPELIKIISKKRNVRSIQNGQSKYLGHMEFMYMYLEDPAILDSNYWDTDKLLSVSFKDTELGQFFSSTKIKDLSKTVSSALPILKLYKINSFEKNIIKILNAVNDLGDEASELVKCTQKIIKEDMDLYYIFYILEAMKDLGNQANTVFKSIINDGMNLVEVINILQTIKYLGDRADKVIKSSQKIIKNDMKADIVIRLLKAIKYLGDEADTVIESSQKLIKHYKDMDQIIRILYVVKDLGAEADTVIESSLKLIEYCKDIYEFTEILKAAKGLGAEADTVIESSLKLIEYCKNIYGIIAIIDTVKGLGAEADTVIESSLKLIEYCKNIYEFPEILKAVKDLGAEADTVIESSLKLIEHCENIYGIIAIIDTVKGLGAEADTVIESSLKLIKNINNEYEAISIINAVKDLGAKAEVYIEFIQKFINIKEMKWKTYTSWEGNKSYVFEFITKLKELACKEDWVVEYILSSLKDDISMYDLYRILSRELKFINNVAPFINECIKTYHVNDSIVKIAQAVKSNYGSVEKFVMNSSKKFIKNTMKGSEICEIIEALKNTSYQEDFFLSVCEYFIRDDMDSAEIVLVIKAVKNLFGNTVRVYTIDGSKELIKNDMSGAEISDIIRALGDLDLGVKEGANLVKAIKALIKDDMTGGDIVEITKTVCHLGYFYAEYIAKRSKYLVNDGMNAADIVKIIKALGKLGSITEDMAKFKNNFINDNMSADEIIEILSKKYKQLKDSVA